jgi:hypothetical protein
VQTQKSPINQTHENHSRQYRETIKKKNNTIKPLHTVTTAPKICETTTTTLATTQLWPQKTSQIQQKIHKNQPNPSTNSATHTNTQNPSTPNTQKLLSYIAKSKPKYSNEFLYSLEERYRQIKRV